MRRANKLFVSLVVIFIFLSCSLAMLGLRNLVRFPGQSYRGALPPHNQREAAIRSELERHLEVLAVRIGERNHVHYEGLSAAARYITRSFLEAGLAVRHQTYRVNDLVYDNIEAEKKGVRWPDHIVVVGAHYDSVVGSPGANDNASGVAGLLSLAQGFSTSECLRTIRFVAFVNEEPPFFWTRKMGSYVYAERCKKRGEKIVAMLSLEMIGYYSNEKNSQNYFFPLGFFYPSQGNFIGFVSNLSSRKLLGKVIESFRRHTQFPSEGGAFPGIVPGIFWSDHWAFWKMGYPALMVTDTAFLRYPYYHTSQDTVDKVNIDCMSRVVAGLEKVLVDLSEMGEGK